MNRIFGLVWRLLVLAFLALWTVSALTYGVFLGELSEVDTGEICQVRDQVFVAEAWQRGEQGPWWQFSSTCNEEYDLVPRWWWLTVVSPVLLAGVIVRTIMRGGPASKNGAA